MVIPELKLETWSHQGAVTMAKATADSIKSVLNNYKDWSKDVDFEVYIQGSYRNDTNIRGDSDVDIIAQLNSTFYSNLSEEQRKHLGLSLASYGWKEFRKDVLRALKNYYGQSLITEGDKSLKVKSNNWRLPADVVICLQYRNYKSVNINDFIEGMCFWSLSDNRQIINYPKIHYDNGVWKNKNTNKCYKPLVRIFKNIRSYISGDSTPSYFLECMLYNIPKDKFGPNYQVTFCNIVNWLNGASLENFICQNGQLKLFGNTPEQWDLGKAKEFINNVIYLWNNW